MVAIFEGSAEEPRRASCTYITANRIIVFVKEDGNGRKGWVEFAHSTSYRNDIGSHNNEFDQSLKLEPYEAKALGEALLKAAREAMGQR